MADTAQWVANVVAVLTGVSGVVIGSMGNVSAKNARHLAERANKIAGDALLEVREANKIAEHANELSENAHTLHQRERAQKSEQVSIKWAVEWDCESAAVLITNHGADAPNNVTVVVTGEHISKREWWDDGPVGGQHRSVALDQVIENRANESLQPILVSGMAGGDAVRGDYHASIDVLLQWLTPLGNPGAKTFQLEVR